MLRQYQHHLLAVEDRMALFFDQAAVPLNFERTKQAILQEIAEVEATIEERARSSGWASPSVPPVSPGGSGSPNLGSER